jgi:hypothetical protein
VKTKVAPRDTILALLGWRHAGSSSPGAGAAHQLLRGVPFPPGGPCGPPATRTEIQHHSACVCVPLCIRLAPCFVAAARLIDPTFVKETGLDYEVRACDGSRLAKTEDCQ